MVDWQLKMRDSSYQWTSEGGRLVRIGDAAHTYLPTAGNGAVQALEDGTSLAECLRLAGKGNIGWATKVHNKLRSVSRSETKPMSADRSRESRFERTSILQQAGFLNREELHSVDIEAFAKNPTDPRFANVGFFKLGRWVWDHDPERYATDNYEAVLGSLKKGEPFENTNVPPGHKYEPWTLESEMARMAAGIPSKLKQNGYWGTDPSYFGAQKTQAGAILAN